VTAQAVTSEEAKPETEPTRTRRGLMIVMMLAIMVVLCSALLVAAEAAVRHRERTRTTVPGTRPSAFYRHDRLKSALVRNQDYYGWFHVNRFGLRGSEIDLEAEPGVTRILAVGGSTTFETQVTADERAWPAQLQQRLNEALPGSRFEVLNAGMEGYSVFDNVIRLQMELFQFKPDVIVMLSGHNDVSCALFGGRTVFGDRPGQVLPQTKLNNWLQSNSELYNKVKARLRAMQFAAQGGGDDSDSDADAGTPPSPSVEAAAALEQPLRCGPEQYRRDVTSFVVLANTFDADVVLVQALHRSGADATSEPNEATADIWRHSRPYAPPDGALGLYVLYRDIQREIAESEGAHFIGTGDFGIEGDAYYGFGDPMHFNDAGAERMGREMASALIEAGVFDQDPPASP